MYFKGPVLTHGASALARVGAARSSPCLPPRPSSPARSPARAPSPGASLLHIRGLHDVGLGRRQLPGPEGEVLVAALEAVDHHGRGGTGAGLTEHAGAAAAAAAAAADTGSSASVRPSPLGFRAVTMPGSSPPRPLPADPDAGPPFLILRPFDFCFRDQLLMLRDLRLTSRCTGKQKRGETTEGRGFCRRGCGQGRTAPPAGLFG